MNPEFRDYIDSLQSKLNQLLAMEPCKRPALPKVMPKAGVYVFSENNKYLYVGRSNDIRGRIGRHCRPSATHRMAAFAFRIARVETGNTVASYKKGEKSRVGLMDDAIFLKAFADAKERVRNMDILFVEEAHPIKQMLLEVYVAVSLQTPYNDFDNH